VLQWPLLQMRGGQEGSATPVRKGDKCEDGQAHHLRAALLAVAAAGLLAAVGLLVVLYAQPAEANYPGKPGKIVFSEYDGQDYEIYTINAGGGGKRPLTDNGTGDYEPYWGSQ
jgi:hypothetical protein